MKIAPLKIWRHTAFYLINYPTQVEGDRAMYSAYSWTIRIYHTIYMGLSRMLEFESKSLIQIWDEH